MLQKNSCVAPCVPSPVAVAPVHNPNWITQSSVIQWSTAWIWYQDVSNSEKTLPFPQSLWDPSLSKIIPAKTACGGCQASKASNCCAACKAASSSMRSWDHSCNSCAAEFFQCGETHGQLATRINPASFTSNQPIKFGKTNAIRLHHLGMVYTTKIGKIGDGLIGFTTVKLQ